jgi:hypothetical protein
VYDLGEVSDRDEGSGGIYSDDIDLMPILQKSPAAAALDHIFSVEALAGVLA